MSKTKICQSCGMPLKKPEHYGTDAGGIPSEIYCIYCWQNGSFTDHCTDVKEFQEHCRTQMVKHGWSKFSLGSSPAE